MRNFESRLRRLEMATTQGEEMISAAEVNDAVSRLWTKFGISRPPDDVSGPISLKAFQAARGSAREKLIRLMDSHPDAI